MLDSGLVERLDLREPAETLQRRLHEGGMFTDLRGDSAEEVAMRRLVSEVFGLGELERTIDRASHPFGWLRGEVPAAVYQGMLAVFVLLSAIGTAIWGMGTLFAVAASPLVLGAVSLAGLAYAARLELKRRDALAVAIAARDRAAMELHAAVERLLATTWAARADNVVVASVPQQTWLRCRLAELRAARSPTEGPQRGACVARLEAALATIEAVLRGPPEAVEAARLQTDIPSMRGEIERLGLPVRAPAPDRRLTVLLLQRSGSAHVG